jgi:hypothetical protein
MSKANSGFGKPLKGLNSLLANTNGTSNIDFSNIEITGGSIDSTVIGGSSPDDIFANYLQTGNSSGEGHDVYFYGATQGVYSRWDNVLGEWDIRGDLRVSGTSRLTSTAASTSSSTGALIVSGGVGMSGRLNIGYQGVGVSAMTLARNDGSSGSDISITGTGFNSVLRISNQSGANGRIDFDGGEGGVYFSFGVSGNSTSSRLSINSTTASTSSSTGALTVSGGVGIGGTTFSRDIRINATGFDGFIINNLNPNQDYFKFTAGPSLSSRAIQVQVSSGGSPLFYTKVGEIYYAVGLPTTSYFTGQHMCYSEDFNQYDTGNLFGLIVSATGEYLSKNEITGQDMTGKEAISINESLPKIELSDKNSDKRVFGVITDSKDSPLIDDNGNIIKDYNPFEYERRIFGRVRVNSLGEGGIWVCNKNGNIENGDYITSCTVPGYGTLQPDDLLHSFTVAKATCNINFSNNLENFQVRYILSDGTSVETLEEAEYTAVFIGCTYHCG